MLSQVIAALSIFLAIFTPNVLRESPIVAKSLDPQSSSSSRSLQFCQNHHRLKSSPRCYCQQLCLLLASCLAAVMLASIPCCLRPCRLACLSPRYPRFCRLVPAASINDSCPLNLIASSRAALVKPCSTPIVASSFAFRSYHLCRLRLLQAQCLVKLHCRPCNLIRHPRPPCSCNCRCLIKPCHNCPMLFDIPCLRPTISTFVLLSSTRSPCRLNVSLQRRSPPLVG